MVRPSLREIGALFFRHANWVFGGGNATVAVLQTELLENKKWIDEETFAFSFALSRLVPGTNHLPSARRLFYTGCKTALSLYGSSTAEARTLP